MKPLRLNSRDSRTFAQSMCVAPKFIGINQADGIGKSGEAYAHAASCFHLIQLPVAAGEAFWLPQEHEGFRDFHSENPIEKHDFVIHYGERHPP